MDLHGMPCPYVCSANLFCRHNEIRHNHPFQGIITMAQTPTLDAIYVGLPKTITDNRGTWTSSIYHESH